MRISNTILLCAIGSAVACEVPDSAPAESVPSTVFCQTPAHLEAMLGAPRPQPTFKADGPRQMRDSFGSFANVKTSEHFALKWGTKIAVEETRAQAILDALERAWQKEIVEMKHPAPASTNAYFYNAYIGNSGEESPNIDFVGGYSTVDVFEWLPYLVLHPDTVHWSDNDIGALVAHELYHSIQRETGGFYEVNEFNGWYFEASAVWMAEEMYPQSIASRHMGLYPLFPHLALHHREWSNDLPSAHQYAAALFLRFLTESLADENFIRDSWIAAVHDTDPFKRLSDMLAERSSTLDEAFSLFAAHASVNDFKNGGEYAKGTDYYAMKYPTYDHRIVGELDLTTVDDEPLSAARETLPSAYGYNVIRVKPGNSAVHFFVVGDERGDLDTPSLFRAVLVRKYDDHNSYTPFIFAGARGTLDVSDLGGEKEVRLVVAAVPDLRRADEHFRFSYGASRLQSDSSAGPSSQGSGCSIGPSTPVRLSTFFALWLVLAALATSRRRSIRHTRR